MLKQYFFVILFLLATINADLNDDGDDPNAVGTYDTDGDGTDSDDTDGDGTDEDKEWDAFKV